MTLTVIKIEVVNLATSKKKGIFYTKSTISTEIRKNAPKEKLWKEKFQKEKLQKQKLQNDEIQ